MKRHVCCCSTVLIRAPPAARNPYPSSPSEISALKFLERATDQSGGFMNVRGRLALVIAVIIASVLVAVPGASAQGRCSLATLNGTYGLVEQGTVVMPGVMGLPVGAATANVALVT